MHEGVKCTDFMAYYRFYDIFEDTEFQDFARDIVQIRENIKLENFGRGIDGGIDGRYISSKEKVTILQVKHYRAYSKTSLKNELKKVKEINPDRYILALSYDVQPDTKEKIKEMFKPYIKSVSDIITNGDLNDCIGDVSGKYKSVERKFYKLWLNNTTMLEEVLEKTLNAKLNRMCEEFLVQAIQESAYFVETGLYISAMSKLKKKHIILISGEPGMGKTTLAKQLALYYLEQYRRDNGFEAKFYWVESVDDLATVLYGRKEEKSRIIIFDDFWGDIFYEERDRGKNETELGRLIEKGRNENRDYFILTTRHYILEQGLKKHEDIRELIESNKLECKLEHYTETEKQKIFYEHLVKADMNYEQIRELFDAANRIIQSENYNLRVIDMFVKQVKDEDMPEELPQELYHFLDEPKKFWDKIFQNLSTEAQYLYKILRIMPEVVESPFVEKVYSHGMKLLDKNMQWKEYGRVIAELEKTIIRTNSTSSGKIVIQFQNPSIKHMIESYLMKNLEQNKDLLMNSCVYYEQAFQLLKMLDSYKMYDEYYADVMGKSLEMADTEDIDIIRQRYDGEYKEKKKSYDEERKLLKYFAVYGYYKAGICSRFKEEYLEYLNIFMEKGIKFPHDLPYYIVYDFPSLAINGLKENILHDIFYVIDVYKEIVIRNGLELDYEEFIAYDKKSCLEHIQRNRSEIEEYLYKWYDYRFCIDVVEENWEDASDLAALYDTNCMEWGISSSMEFWNTCNKYESRFDELFQKQLGDKEDVHNKRKENFEDVKKEYWERYFSFDEDTENEESMRNDKEQMFDYEYYIRELFFQKSSEQENYSLKDLVDSLTDLGCIYFKDKRRVWREKELKELCCDEFDMCEEQWELLFQRNILKRKGKFAAIVYPDIFVLTFLYQFYYVEERDKEQDYEQLFFSEQAIEDEVIWLGIEIIQEDSYSLLGAMLNLDESAFRKCVTIPLAKKFYEENYSSNRKQLIDNLLCTLDFTIFILEGERNPAIISPVYDIIDIIELDKGFYVRDMIPEELNKEQVESYSMAGILEDSDKENLQKVKLQKLYEYNFLNQNEVETYLLKLWNIILEYVGESENE